ncbi:hypothetical protein ACP275_13G007700 [Erythranthe tilingii]
MDGPYFSSYPHESRTHFTQIPPQILEKLQKIKSMALHLSYACFSAFSGSKVRAVRAVASEQGSAVTVKPTEDEKAAKTAFNANTDGGITFFDTAEVYGSRMSFGAISSETLLGRFIKERKQKEPDLEVSVATKYAALTWRIGHESVISALKDSLSRLELSCVDLYQLQSVCELISLQFIIFSLHFLNPEKTLFDR